jgi:uncharacterized protein involved in type VI secretion and phage assembly
VTNVAHIYSSEGFRSEFSVAGLHTGQLSEALGVRPDVERWPGIVPAIVTNTEDPEDWGRVKVKFPWMAENAESDWARVISPGAGPEAGFYLMPDNEDEVMVCFEHGDFNRPYVLGGVWNGKHAIPSPAAGAGSDEKPLVRSWHSREGHHITMYDNPDKKIEIITIDGQTITIDDANKKIEIKSGGGNSMTMDDNAQTVKVDSQGKVEIDSKADITITSAANIKIKASGMLDLQASGNVTVKGAMINLN